jgi:hypothetical protein
MVLTAREMVSPAGPAPASRSEKARRSLCRCGRYAKIIDAVEEDVTLPDDAGPRVGFLDGDTVVDAGFDGRAFIEAGPRQRRVADPSGPVAPLRPGPCGASHLRGPPQERVRRPRQSDPRRVVHK